MFSQNTNLEQLGRIIHLEDFSFQLISEKNWILAFSGGADSVLTLEILLQIHQIFPTQRTLIIYFLDHGDQEKSTAEMRQKIIETHLARVSDQYPQIRIIREFYRRNLVTLTQKKRKNFEHTSSKIRWKNLFRMFRKYHGSLIVTGHNMSDWYETLLIRLNRGAAITGFYPFLPLEVKNNAEIFRPLSYLSHAEVRELCHNNDLQYWDDPSNHNDSNERSRIRKKYSIENAKGFRISARNLAAEKVIRLENLKNILVSLLPDLQEITSGREYHYRLDRYTTMPESQKDILLDYIFEKLNFGPISGAIRISARNHSLNYNGFHIERENWNNCPVVVFRKGRNNSGKPPLNQTIDPGRILSGYGSSCTNRHYIQFAYGKKSVKKIFSEKKLSRRQKEWTPVYFNASNPLEVKFLDFSIFGILPVYGMDFKS